MNAFEYRLISYLSNNVFLILFNITPIKVLGNKFIIPFIPIFTNAKL